MACWTWGETPARLQNCSTGDLSVHSQNVVAPPHGSLFRISRDFVRLIFTARTSFLSKPFSVMTKLDFEYLRALAYSLVTGKALNVSTFVQPVSVPMTVRFSEDSRPSRLGRRVGTIENIY